MPTTRSTGQWSLAVRQQACVARLGQMGLKGGDLEDLMGEALMSIAATLGVGDIAMLELFPQTKELIARVAVHDARPVAAHQVTAVRFAADGTSMAGHTVSHGVPVVSADLSTDGRFEIMAPEYGIVARAAVTVPVGWGAAPWGVLVVYSAEPREWTTDDLHFLESMANTVGLAIARRRVEQELRDSSARLDLSLAAGGLGAWNWDPATDTVEYSPTAMDVYDLSGDSFEGRSGDLLAIMHPDDRDLMAAEITSLIASPGTHHMTYRIIRTDGEVRWVESWGCLLDDNGQAARLAGVVRDVTDRLLNDQRMVALFDAEKAARVEAEQARERLTLLASATARFSASLDPDAILAWLPEFCVPLLADVCLVDLFDGLDRLGEVASATIDPQALMDLRNLRRSRDEWGYRGPWSSREVARTAQGMFAPALTDEEFQEASGDATQLALWRSLNPTSVMIVPLVARGRVIGVLTLVTITGTATAGRPEQADSMAFVEELAARAAVALDNARLYASRNRVARSLQAALLPPALPQIEGLDLAARYRVAEADIEIGGDFYDVMEVGEGAWAVVVGDVCGRGPDAAALTGLMRHSVRTAVVREALPSRVLAQTNDAVLDQIDDARFCTAAFLRLEPGAVGEPVKVLASCAGHPRPVVLRADGRAELIECAGLLLGVVPSPTLVDVEVTLGPGDAVILYTDGVTEARRGRELFGDCRLLAAVSALAGQDAEGVAAGLEAAVSAFQDGANDDVAIVVVGAQRSSAPQPGRAR